jgi:hypothetical protein
MAMHAHKKSSFIPDPVNKPKNITQYVVTTMALEGVTLRQDVLDDFAACDRGELTERACFERVIQRLIAQQKELDLPQTIKVLLPRTLALEGSLSHAPPPPPLTQLQQSE